MIGLFFLGLVALLMWVLWDYVETERKITDRRRKGK